MFAQETRDLGATDPSAAARRVADLFGAANWPAASELAFVRADAFLHDIDGDGVTEGVVQAIFASVASPEEQQHFAVGFFRQEAGQFCLGAKLTESIGHCVSNPVQALVFAWEPIGLRIDRRKAEACAAGSGGAVEKRIYLLVGDELKEAPAAASDEVARKVAVQELDRRRVAQASQLASQAGAMANGTPSEQRAAALQALGTAESIRKTIQALLPMVTGERRAAYEDGLKKLDEGEAMIRQALNQASGRAMTDEEVEAALDADPRVHCASACMRARDACFKRFGTWASECGTVAALGMSCMLETCQ